ncbi:MAG: hypothetical protein C0407_18490, partial [Desulfobacca sp.]|nr:hypothetical protein [Desulfobacca sp.]
DQLFFIISIRVKFPVACYEWIFLVKVFDTPSACGGVIHSAAVFDNTRRKNSRLVFIGKHRLFPSGNIWMKNYKFPDGN